MLADSAMPFLSFLSLNQITFLSRMEQELDLSICQNWTVMAVKQHYWTVEHLLMQLVYTIVTTRRILGCIVKVMRSANAWITSYGNSLLWNLLYICFKTKVLIFVGHLNSEQLLWLGELEKWLNLLSHAVRIWGETNLTNTWVKKSKQISMGSTCTRVFIFLFCLA